MCFKLVPTTVLCVVLLTTTAFCLEVIPSSRPTLPEVVGSADVIVFGRAFLQSDYLYRVFVSRTLYGEPIQETYFFADLSYSMGKRKDAFASRLPSEAIYYLEKLPVPSTAANWRTMEPGFDLDEVKEKIDVLGEPLGELRDSESFTNIQRLIDMRRTPGKYLRIPEEADSVEFAQILGLLFRDQKVAAVDGISRQTAVAQIKHGLSSPNKWTVVYTLKALMASGSKDVAFVTPLLKHPEPIVRQRAGSYLQWCAAP